MNYLFDGKPIYQWSDNMMKKLLIRLAVVSLSASLCACSSNGSSQENEDHGRMASAYNKSLAGNGGREPFGPTYAASGRPIGGSFTSSMDSVDRTKMSRALDKPVGNSTSWTNANTGITYTISPTKKVVINNNPYCREYNASAKSGNRERSYSGSACVGSDSNWQAVR